jgi:putative transposase
MIKSFKIKLYPDKEQADKIIQFCNAARFAYNWALNVEIENYKSGNKFISGYDLAKLLTSFKREEENKWLKDISSRATKNAVMNCATAFESFFKKKAKYPKFKSKKFSRMSCATHEGTTLIDSKEIRLEKLGWVKCSKHNIEIKEDLKIYNPKLSYDGVDFWFSVSIDFENKISDKLKTEVIGIDLGIKTLAVCSNGIKLKKPFIKDKQKKLKRLQRRVSRYYSKMIDSSKQTKTKFDNIQKSKNLLKLEKDIKRLHIKIKNILDNNIHTFTKKLVDLNPKAIVMEDLNVKGMMKNRHLSKAIGEAKFYEIRRQLEYKCLWNNVELVVADRWFASSKICSCCGNKKDKLSLSERVYVCDICEVKIDRDLNASYNLRNLVL